MDKDIVKEIFLLIFEIIKAICETLRRKTKEFLIMLWDRFFGMADVSREQPPYQEWGVTGEDMWPAKTQRYPKKPEAAEPRERKRVSYPSPVTELPENYGDNRVVLMVKDPAWLFGYWEIRKDAAGSALNTLGDKARTARIVLRVYDTTDILFNGHNAHTYFDIEITENVHNWYIHTGKPGRWFCADIGFLASDGTFCVLARSNTVQTPDVKESAILEEGWPCIEEFYERAFLCMSHGICEYIPGKSPRGWQKILLRTSMFSPGSSRG
jgi:hypothetical protein